MHSNFNIKDSYVSFKIGQQLYAVNVQNVLEVLERNELTDLPETPEHIIGVINFRGEIVPIVDLAMRLSLKEHPKKEKITIIIFELDIDNEKIRIGTSVDDVNDVLEINRNEVKNIPKIHQRISSEFIQGMVERENDFIILLYMAKLLTQGDLESIQESLANPDNFELNENE